MPKINKSLIDFHMCASKVLIIIAPSEHIICCSFAENPDSVVQSYFSRFEEQWFSYCNEELEKINTFFAGKLCIECY